jgi:hypothetical protein
VGGPQPKHRRIAHSGFDLLDASAAQRGAPRSREHGQQASTLRDRYHLPALAARRRPRNGRIPACKGFKAAMRLVKRTRAPIFAR